MLKLAFAKHRKISEVPSSNLKGLLKPWVVIKWAKQLGKPNLKAENSFCLLRVGGRTFYWFSNLHVQCTERDYGSAYKQLEKPPEALGGHEWGKTT